MLDASSRRVAAVCGPVGTARTVVVRSAGAHVGFRGLVSHKAMVTLHYKGRWPSIHTERDFVPLNFTYNCIFITSSVSF